MPPRGGRSGCTGSLKGRRAVTTPTADTENRVLNEMPGSGRVVQFSEYDRNGARLATPVQRPPGGLRVRRIQSHESAAALSGRLTFAGSVIF